MTALEQSLAAHEKALKALRVEHQIQATELRTAEEEVEGLRATLLKKVSYSLVATEWLNWRQLVHPIALLIQTVQC